MIIEYWVFRKSDYNYNSDFLFRLDTPTVPRSGESIVYKDKQYEVKTICYVYETHGEDPYRGAGTSLQHVKIKLLDAWS